MLLEEVTWTQAPPQGIKPLPGTLVVGQVALWGSIIEHARRWRAQFAYPSQLYVLSDNALLAQALRERYLVPVASGQEAAVLEQVLPLQVRNLWRARAGSAEAKRSAFSDVPAVPCPVPTVVELVHAQERKALERARERVELARDALRLEEQRIAAERQALELDDVNSREPGLRIVSDNFHVNVFPFRGESLCYVAGSSRGRGRRGRDDDSEARRREDGSVRRGAFSFTQKGHSGRPGGVRHGEE
jgi:hypothetical protein